MLNLPQSPSTVLQVVTGSAVTAGVTVHASFVDIASTATASSSAYPNYQNSEITTATTTTVVAAPSAGNIRNVRHLSIANGSTTQSTTIAVQHNDGTTVTQFGPACTLQPGWSWVYDEGSGPKIFDGNGNLQQAQTQHGAWVKRTVILNGTTSFTTQTTTNSILARMLAGGGQGGGAPATAGLNGSGGGAGSYAEWSVAVSPATAYTCAVGAGGSTGGTGATGQTGGATTLAIGGTTVTCNGGVGGVASATLGVPVLGGAGGAVSTNGTTNVPGEPGSPVFGSATAVDTISGAGASSQLGNGGAAQLESANATGLAAGGYGAGGGGAATTGTARAGGAGSAGIIIIDEYT